jgi:hypothetical protein
MPRVTGAKSTRQTLPIEFAEVESFVGVWDRYVNKKVCVIEGCGHIVSGSLNEDWKAGGPVGEEPWATCGEGSGAGIVSDLRVGEGSTDKQIRNRVKGAACVCCVDKINEMALERNRAQYGDPD